MSFLETCNTFGSEDVIIYKEHCLKLGETLSYYWDEVVVSHETPRESSKLCDSICGYKKVGLLPLNTKFKGDYLLSKKDGSQYIHIKGQDWSNHWVKFRRVRTSSDFLSHIGDTIDIVSLVCLFSTNGINAHLHNGDKVPFNALKNQETSPILKFVWDKHISQYEVESVYRLTSYINQLMGWESSRYHTVRLQLPLVAYYLYGLEEYEKKTLNNEALLSLYDTLDSRVARMQDILSKRINGSVVMEYPLQEIREYLRTCAMQDISPSMDRAVEILSKDELWSLALGYKKPMHWRELSWDLWEVIWEMRPSFEKDGRISVVVKNPKEENSLNLTKKISKHIYNSTGRHINVLGMYPHEQVVLNHTSRMTKQRMYDVKQKPTYSNVKDIISHYVGNILD